ncbi:hypothetical protein V8E51_004505 [Hyaloscypha variabilis]
MHHPCVGMAFAICAMFTLVLSASIQKGQILNIVEASWIGEVGGHAFQLNGTAGVQSPFGLAQLKATHPEIELPKNTNDALAAVENLAKRNKITPPLCLQCPHTPTGKKPKSLMLGSVLVFSSASTLEFPLELAGNSYAIDPASSYLASYVLDIVSDCWDQFGDTVGGQEFDTDDYNVIVRGNGGNDGSC